MSKILKEIIQDKPINVTFIIIAFNESNGIVNCISSVLNQNIEASKATITVLVIDDGSTDGTASLVEKTFSSKVTVIRQENAGRGFARLKGIENAKTPLIAMVDSDILIPRDWLTICLDALDSNAGVGGLAIPDGDCATIQRIFHLSPKIKKGSITVSGNNALFLTDALIHSGRNWLTPLGEDFRLNQVLQRRGSKLKRIDNLVVQHIEHKTYRQSLSWLYRSGVDATQLWLEFRITRVPDIATVMFFASIISVPIFAQLIGFWSYILPFALVLSVGLGHLVSKFYFHKNWLGFISALLPNSVLMLSYFLGRIFGTILLVKFVPGRE